MESVSLLKVWGMYTAIYYRSHVVLLAPPIFLVTWMAVNVFAMANLTRASLFLHRLTATGNQDNRNYNLPIAGRIDLFQWVGAGRGRGHPKDIPPLEKNH